jgi:hypothetical protein
MFPTSWEHLRPVPYQRDLAREVTASHDKSRPRTTSLVLARQVSASHDKSSPRTRSLHPARAPPDSDWGVGHDTRHDLEMQTPPTRRVGDRFPAPCNHTRWRPTQAVGPDMSLNAGLLSCVAIPLSSSPTLPHASFSRGTQAPPTTSSSLQLGLNVAG